MDGVEAPLNGGIDLHRSSTRRAGPPDKSTPVGQGGGKGLVARPAGSSVLSSVPLSLFGWDRAK